MFPNYLKNLYSPPTPPFFFFFLNKKNPENIYTYQWSSSWRWEEQVHHSNSSEAAEVQSATTAELYTAMMRVHCHDERPP